MVGSEGSLFLRDSAKTAAASQIIRLTSELFRISVIAVNGYFASIGAYRSYADAK
jgi:hypothetical protein